MTPALLTQILDDINTLDADELRIVVQAVREHLRQSTVKYSPEALPKQDPVLVLFAQRDEDDAGMTADEVASDNQQWHTFMDNTNDERGRAGTRHVF